VDLIVTYPKDVLILGLVPLKPGEAADPNSPRPGFRCEAEAEGLARTQDGEGTTWLRICDLT
jgi:hypothetical protein